MNIWDKKANNYQRFTDNISEFQARVMAILGIFNVNFSDKNVIDIGCGTGVYTLLIAKKAKFITGIDSSKNMLKILNEDASKFNIKNLNTLNLSWSEFSDKFNDKKSPNLAYPYDIAISTMSPAIAQDDDFKLFNKLGKTKIYLNWQAPRTSDLLEPFFAKFGRKRAEVMATDRLKMWLKENDIKFQSEILSETRIARRTFNEALENINWHMQINGLNPQKSEIKTILEPLCKDGFVDEKIDTLMRLFVF